MANLQALKHTITLYRSTLVQDGYPNTVSGSRQKFGPGLELEASEGIPKQSRMFSLILTILHQVASQELDPAFIEASSSSQAGSDSHSIGMQPTIQVPSRYAW